MRDDGKVVVFLLVDLIQPFRPVDIFDLDLETGFFQLGRNDLPPLARIIIHWRQFQGKFQPVRISGFRQELFRFFRIIRIGTSQVDIVRMMRGKMRADWRSKSEHRAIDNFLPVDRMGNCLANLELG